MTLPKISHAIFKTEVPSLKEEKRFRPFTVKEEKLLMLAASNDEQSDEAVETIKQVINNCTIDPLNLDDLALFDIEWLFVQLRINSIGSIIELNMTEDDVVFEGILDLKDVKITRSEGHTNKIVLDEKQNVGVVMEYPSLDTIKLLSEENEIDNSFKAFSSCVAKIFDADKVYVRNDDFNEKDLEEFIDSLPRDSIEKFAKFFETMPKMVHEISLFDKDKNEKKFILSGIKDFF